MQEESEQETIDVKVTVKTNKVGSECYHVVTIDKEEWDEMTEDEREEDLKDVMYSMMDWNYYVVES